MLEQQSALQVNCNSDHQQSMALGPFLALSSSPVLPVFEDLISNFAGNQYCASSGSIIK